MWELDCEESWAPNWCFWTVVLEKTLVSPLDCKEIQPVHPKGNQSWIFIGRTDAEAETPILWPPDATNWLTAKTPMLGRSKAGGEGDDGLWDGWMASPTQWAWVWVNSRSWWWTGRPGALHSVDLKKKKMYNLRVASQVLFGAKWGLQPSRQHVSSERLLQSGSGGKSILMKREFNTMKHSFYKRFFVNHEDLMSPWRNLFSASLDVRRCKDWDNKICS